MGPPMGQPMGPPIGPPMGPPMGQPTGPAPPSLLPALPPWAQPPMVERSFAGIVGAGNRGGGATVDYDFGDGDFVMDGVVIKPKKSSKWRAVGKKKFVAIEPELRRDVYSAPPSPYVGPNGVPGFVVPAQGFGPPPMAAYIRRS